MFSDCCIKSVSETNSKIFNSCGHVKGMLDRDQRTAKMISNVNRDSDNSHEMFMWPQNVCDSGSSQKSTMNSPSAQPYHRRHSFRPSWCYFCRKNRRISRNNLYVRRVFQRLKQALIVSVYLLGFVSVPCTLTAPTINMNMNDPVTAESYKSRMESTPKWYNPCSKSQNSGNGSGSTGVTLKDSDLIETIHAQAMSTNSYIKTFVEEFVEHLFNQNLEAVLEEYQIREQPWLPTKEQIPKEFGEDVPYDHLQAIDLQKILINMSESLQRIAVGLEQVTWDQEDTSGSLVKKFENAEYNNRLLLCEIESALLEKDIRPPLITRDIIPFESRFKNKSKTSAKIRALTVYTSYLNVLEYITQVFTHLAAANNFH